MISAAVFQSAKRCFRMDVVVLLTAASCASDIEPVDGDVEIFLIGRFLPSIEFAPFVDVFTT